MLITKEPPLLKIAEWLQSVPFKTMKSTWVLTGFNNFFKSRKNDILNSFFWGEGGT